MSRLHIDIINTAAWNACIAGKKEWLFFPPSEKPYLYDSQVNAFEPDLERFPEFQKAKGFKVTQKPGDLIYTPSGWWHTVKNIDPSIALTDNFINRYNIKRFFTHFIPGANHLLVRTWKRRGTARNRNVELS